MQRIAFASAVTLLLASGAQPLKAQSLFFGTQCVSGSFMACASVELWNETDAATGQLYLYVRVANMQGTRNLEHLGPSGLAHIRINDLTVEDPTLVPIDIWTRTERSTGYSTLSGNTSHCLTLAGCHPISSYDVGEFWAAVVTNDRPGTGRGYYDGDEAFILNSLIFDSYEVLWGCDFPESGMGNHHYYGPATCNGWVTWSVNMGYGGGFRLSSDVSVDLDFIGFDESGREVAAGCLTGVDCVTVTPEPGTIILVGTGLAGIAAARRRRKKQV